MKIYQNKLLLALALLLLIFGLTACQNKPQQEPGRSELTTDLLSKQPQTSVTAFFKAPDCPVLVPLVFGINSSRDTIWVALEKLLAGPPDAFVEAVIPAGIKMKDLYFADGTVHIKLTGDVPLQVEQVNLQAFWSTVNMELLEQDNTTAALLLYYNDQPLLNEPYTAAAVNDFGGGQAGAYVYFADPQAMYLVPVCFVGGFLGGMLGLVCPPLGQLMGAALSVPAELILAIAKGVSRLPLAAVYLSGPGVGWWLLDVYALFIVTYPSRGKRPYRPLAPLMVSALSLVVLTGVVAARYREDTTIAAVDVGQGQSIVCLNEQTTMVIDCGGDFNGAAGDRTGAYLLGRGRKVIDLLVLTHLHQDHANGVTRLMARVPVKRLILRENADDDGERDKILQYAERYGTEVTFLTETAQFTLDRFDLTLYLPPYKGENQAIVVQVSVGAYDALVLGDVNNTTDKWLAREFELPDGELIVVGHHGAKTSTGEVLLDAFTPETALISVGYNNYGHPTPEVLERLAVRNITVHQTREEGTVELRIDEYGKERKS